MADPREPAQEAVIARFRGDTILQGILHGYNSAIVGPEWNIFDRGGSGQITPVFPIVYVQPITQQFPGTVLVMGIDAVDVFLQVDVYTSFEGFEDARIITARCYALLHRPAGAAPLTIPGFSNPWTTYQNGAELEETTDRPIQHIADRVKLWISG